MQIPFVHRFYLLLDFQAHILKYKQNIQIKYNGTANIASNRIHVSSASLM